MVFSLKELNIELYINSVGIPMGYRLDGQGSIPGRGERCFSTLWRPDWLWGPPSFLSKRYQGQSGRWEADHSPPSNAKDRIVELYLHSPIRLHGAGA
jgi:hypothetical protein